MLRTMLYAIPLALACLTGCGQEQGNTKICVDQCGDGECQAMVCLGEGCPCAETPDSCPQDCAAPGAEVE